MTLTVSPAMIAHLKGTKTLATLVKVTEVNQDGSLGTTVAITNHTRNITYNSVNYLAVPFIPSQLQSHTGFEHDNAQLKSGYSSPFDSKDLRHLRWLRARVEMNVVNYLDLTMGPAVRKIGLIGAVTVKDWWAEPDFRSLSQLLDQTVATYCTELCNVVRLGDSRCGVNLSGNTVDTGLPITSTATVTAVTDRQQFTVTNNQIATIPSDFFKRGHVIWSSGNNNGDDYEVMTNVGGFVVLLLPTGAPILVGDTLTMQAGCDRTIATCRQRFNNAVRNRSFYMLPGRAKLFKYPDTSQLGQSS